MTHSSSAVLTDGNEQKDLKEAKIKLIMKLHGLDDNACDLVFSLVPGVVEYSEKKIINICRSVVNGTGNMKDIVTSEKALLPKGKIGFSEMRVINQILSEQS